VIARHYGGTVIRMMGEGKIEEAIPSKLVERCTEGMWSERRSVVVVDRRIWNGQWLYGTKLGESR